MHTVLVTRPQPAADEFAALLRQAGFRPYVAPLMEYVGLDADLDDLASCQALIFTSAYTVHAFCKLSKERDLPVFAVGDKTAETASRAGFVRVYSAQGDSSDVTDLIRTHAERLGLRKIMHPCSEDTPHDITDTAARDGITVVHWPIYKAHFVDALPLEIEQAITAGAIDAITLFSARTGSNLAKIMATMPPDVCRKIAVICISDKVVDAVRHLPWRIIRIANRPDSESMLEATGGGGRMFERRKNPAARDAQGQIQSSSYTGPDRRKTYKERQHSAIVHEKMMIARRMMITFVCSTVAIGTVAWLMLAPEYTQVKEAVREYGVVGMVQAQVAKLQKNVVDTASNAATGVASYAGALGENSLNGLVNAIYNMDVMQATPGGQVLVGQSLATLRDLLGQTPGDSDALNSAIDAARKEDPTLTAMLDQVDGQDLAAAALLLTLNEFRDNVDNSRPYADDLALLSKFTGNDPKMKAALKRLAPYAERGVISRSTLQEEFKGLAGDIVTAKLTGQDVDVQETARRRLEKLMQEPGEAENATGTEAIVARAQAMLDKGDVKGAMAELQKLDGASAQAVAPWLEQAQGFVAADASADALSQGLLQAVSGASGFSLDGLVSMIKDTLGTRPSSVYVSPAFSGGEASSVLAP